MDSPHNRSDARAGTVSLVTRLMAGCLALCVIAAPARAQVSQAHAVAMTESSPPLRLGSQYHPGHARGRANLSTLAPMVVGSILIEANAPQRGGRGIRSTGYIIGTCLAGLGVLVGPSTGLWCTGEHRTAWLSMGVRAGGIGAFAAGAWRMSRELDGEGGFAALVAAPYLTLIHLMPGLLITSAGAGWALRSTPDSWCDGSSRAQAVVHPQIDAGGAGMALSVTW